MVEMWLLASQGKGYGPFTSVQLQHMAEAGLVDADDLVWREGDDNSLPVSSIRDQSPEPTIASETGKSRSNLKTRYSPSRISGRAAQLAVSSILLLGFGIAVSFWMVKFKGSDTTHIETVEPPQTPQSLQYGLPQDTTNQSGRTAGNPTSKTAEATASRPPVPVFSITFDNDLIGPDELVANGIRLADGIDGKAGHFQDKRSIRVPCTIPQGGTPRTLSVWLKSDGISEARNSHAVSCGNDDDGSLPWGIGHLNGKWFMYGWGGQRTTDAAVDSEWHHHCLTFDGTTISYWFDGDVIATVQQRFNSSGGVSLGTYASGSSYYAFSGLIDEIALYDSALNKGQVARLVNRGSR